MRRAARFMIAVVLYGLATSLPAQDALPKRTEKVLDYPPTKVENVIDILHGVAIEDPYRWLEDGNSPQVKAWVDSQNKFTQARLEKVPGRDKIRERLDKLLKTGTLGTPVPVKGHYFYTRRDGDQNQAILYVREGVQGKDRVLLDVNQLAKDGTIALDWWFPSKDGKLLAYGISKDGSEQSTLHIRDVASAKDLPDNIERTRYTSVAWLPDSKGFYYTRYPAIGSVPKGQENYNRHVFYHELGSDPKIDPKVFGEGRPAEDMISVAISPDGRWLVATCFQGWAKSEVYFRDNNSREKKFVPLVEGLEAVFDVIPRSDRFYVHTNFEAPRYRLFQVDPRHPQREKWVEKISQDPRDKLENVAAVGDWLVAEYMHNATSQLRFLSLGTKKLEWKTPAVGTISGLGGEWDGHELFVGFQSFTIPTRVLRIDMNEEKAHSFAELIWGKVDADVDADAYEAKQVKYKSKDGTEISMFITHKKGLTPTGTTPALLYGYGGFNISLTPMFSASNMLFLEKGGVIAIPNLRGGGEYGEDWHRAGMLDKKQNTFDDFIAAAEWLIENKYTDRDHLAIMGRSNGGLLVGAALTQRPDLFRAVVCGVPLLDMLRYHKFLIARLWIPEYGSADDPEQFKFIRAYSPYQKVTPGTAYPAVLLTTAAADSRVDPLHARKMAARLQAATISARPILLRQETQAGHGQGKPRAMVVEEQTDVWSFLFAELGM